MTATHDHVRAEHEERHGDSGPIVGRSSRWLIPVLVIGGAIAAVLVISGAVSASLLIYAAVLGGCGLMHVFGHGGHGGHGGGTPPAER